MVQLWPFNTFSWFMTLLLCYSTLTCYSTVLDQQCADSSAFPYSFPFEQPTPTTTKKSTLDYNQ